MILAAAPQWAAVFHREAGFRRGRAVACSWRHSPQKHFPAKCEAVRRGKCDKCKNLERVSDSKGTETALEFEQNAGRTGPRGTVMTRFDAAVPAVLSASP